MHFGALRNIGHLVIGLSVWSILVESMPVTSLCFLSHFLTERWFFLNIDMYTKNIRQCKTSACRSSRWVWNVSVGVSHSSLPFSLFLSLHLSVYHFPYPSVTNFKSNLLDSKLLLSLSKLMLFYKRWRFCYLRCLEKTLLPFFCGTRHSDASIVWVDGWLHVFTQYKRHAACVVCTQTACWLYRP